jgi:hypothetical protein
MWPVSVGAREEDVPHPQEVLLAGAGQLNLGKRLEQAQRVVGGGGEGASPGGRHLGVLVEGEGIEEEEEEGGFFFGSTGLGVPVAHTHESTGGSK